MKKTGNSQILVLGVSLLVLPGLAKGQELYEYQGTGSTTAPVTGNWNDDNNWLYQGTFNFHPLSDANNILSFGGSGSGTYTSTNDIGANFALNQLVFNSSSTGLSTVNGSSLDFKTDGSFVLPTITQNNTGAFVVANDMKLSSSVTVNGSGTGAVTLSGIISGTAPNTLTFNGSNTTTLSGINTYLGTTTVNSGTVRALTNAAALGAGSLTLAGGTLELASDTATTFGRNTTITGNTTINSDRATAGAGTTQTLGTVSIGAQTLTVGGGSNVTSGVAGVTLGVTTLTGNATFNVNNPAGGGTTLLTTGNTAIGTNTLTIQGAGDSKIGGAITGTTGSLVKNGTGTLSILGATTFTGGVTLNNGTIIAGSTTALGFTGSVGTLNGGSLLAGASGVTIANTLNLGGNVTFGASSGSALNTYAGAKNTTGNITLTFNDGTTTFNTAALTLGGNLTVAGNGGLNITGGLTLTGGDRVLTYSSTTAGIVAVTNLNANTLTVQGATGATFNNVISGTGGFTKAGSGSVTLSGSTANTYSGLTTVSAGELVLGKNAAINAVAGNILINGGTLRLAAQNQIADTSTITITDGGTFNLAANGEQVASLTISSTNPLAPAVVNLGNAIGSPALILSSNAATFGDNTQLIGNGTLKGTGAFTLNLNGGTVSGDVTVGGAITGTVVNITKGSGGGNILLGASVATLSTINLNQTGSINLGSTFVAISNTSGNTGNGVVVNVATGATGISGGTITVALQANAANPNTTYSLYGSAANALTFTAGAVSPFTLSGNSIIDVRSSTAASGNITTNGRDLVINGGMLLGNRLVSTTGAITLSSGTLALRSMSGTAPANDFTISTSAGTNGRTITMGNNTTGTFSAASTVAGNKIIIGTQSTGGTWNQGTVNAGANYTITNSAGTSPFSATTATYSVADNAGLNGIALGSSAVPTSLTLGANSSFFATSTLAATRTYNVGVAGGGNDIITAAAGAGGFTFGVNNTAALLTGTQIINLNRDKSTDTINLLANGTSANSAINIAVNQTGSGNLNVNTRNLTLNAGVTFGGTGGIFNDSNPSDYVNQSILSNSVGDFAGSTIVPVLFTINGTINGTNTVNLGAGGGSLGQFVLGTNAVVGGVQNWTSTGVINAAQTTVLDNRMTTASNWSGSVTFNNKGAGGNMEASTSVTSPSASSHYKIDTLNITPGGSSSSGYYKLVNTVQNDGSAPGVKEALYVGSFVVGGGIGDGSNGKYNLNLNGQDLYVDRFANVTGVQNKGLLWQNDALNSVSQIKAVSTTGDTLSAGGFQVLNGATIEVVGGNYNALVYGRNTGTIVADTAAAANVPVQPNNVSIKSTLSWDNTAQDVGTFTSFLGSGGSVGNNTGANGSSFLNTNGTFRVLGGTFSSSGYILNAVGTTGTLSTVGTGDTTLNDVRIRAVSSQTVTGASGSSSFTVPSGQVFAVGDPVQFAGVGTTGLSLTATYYVVSVSGNNISVATTPGGTPITSAGTFVTGSVFDVGGSATAGGNGTASSALVVAGTTNIEGNLVFQNAPGATVQSTLRVGGIQAGTGTLATGSNNAQVQSGGAGYTNGTYTVTVNYTTGGTPGTIQGTAVVSGNVLTSIVFNNGTITGAAITPATTFGTITGITGTQAATVAGIFVNGTVDPSSATLNVTGDLTVGSTNNVAIQSNGTVKVAGNVDIQGVGINAARNVTGTGVGIDANSNFTLNGNKGTATPQTVNIIPSVGKFHVGDGSAGTLTGTAAQVRLTGNLTTASADINGPTSSLNLNTKILTVGSGAGTLMVAGSLNGTGTVVGNVNVLAGGTFAPGNSPGIITVVGSADFDSASTYVWDLASNFAQLTLQGATPVFDQTSISGGLNIDSGALISLALNGAGSTVDFTNGFWSSNQQWLLAESTGLTGIWTLGSISLDSAGHSYSSYGSFGFTTASDDVFLTWTAAAVPEPSTYVLLGMGLGALWFLRRKKQA